MHNLWWSKFDQVSEEEEKKMTYILTLWLLWAAGDNQILQVGPFASLEACTQYALNFIQEVKSDGVVASSWTCKFVEEEDV